MSSLGFERPFFGNDFIGTDLGPGDLSGFPALSGGIGLEAGRIGEGFGIGATKLYVRTTWGEFEDRFTTVAIPAGAFSAQEDFVERTFTNQTVHGALILDRFGFSRTGRALTLQIVGGGVQYALDSDRPVIVGTAIPGSPGAFPNAFHRVNNRQSEASLWWMPGPFTFGVAWNHTFTHFKRVNPLGGSESRENENDKIELIGWFSF